MNITVIGTVYVDIKGFPSGPRGSFVPSGRNAGEVRQFHGGVGRNIAEDVANLGVSTNFVSLVEQGGIGADVTAHLQRRGICTDYLRATADGMGTWLAIFDEAGEVCANISKRPNLLPICDILAEDGDKIFANTDSILLEMDIDEEIVSAAFALAEKYNIPVYGVISNMTIARERLPYIRRTSCFTCNLQEAGILFNLPTENLSPAEMLAALKENMDALGIGTMIVTMDAQGAVYASDNGESGHCPALKVEVINTTGAGDSFFAASSVALTRGENLAAACRLGTEIAAVVICSEDNVYPRKASGAAGTPQHQAKG